jgi:septal ring factor EnvC (AmiA/AmiB activator)
MQSFALSVLTDNKNNNSTQLDVSRLDAGNVDVFRQLLNQETLIRMTLVKNVHALMKDMVDLKQNMKTLEATQQKTESEVTNLRQEVESLKRENQKLEAKNRKCEDTLNTVKQNFTQVNEHFEEFTPQSEKKRETFERNTSTVLSDIKIEVRYLSVTLLDLNKHTLEIDRGISEMIEKKYEILSNGLNSTMETFNNELITTSNKMSGLENLQKLRITSMFGKFKSL